MKRKTDKNRTGVLYIDNSFTFGGAIISLKTTLQALDQRKYRPVLISAQPAAYLEENFPDIEWHHLDLKLPWIHNQYYKKIAGSGIVRRSIFLQKIVRRGRFVVWLACFILPEAGRIYRIGKRAGVRLIHLNNAFDGQLSGIAAARLLGVPCLAHLRGYQQDYRTARIAAARIDYHIAISRYIRDNLLALGVPREKIAIVYDSVDPTYFPLQPGGNGFRSELGIPPATLLIGLFGRIIPWKGVREFVLAVKQVHENYRDFKAVVVGDASDEADDYWREVKQLVARLELETIILFTGYRPDVVALMGAMDIVVHASIAPEPFGMVIIEAMACGRPVVASSVGGGPLEIVQEGETGFLVHPARPEEMSSALTRLLRDRALRERFGRAGRKRVEAVFDSSRHARKIEQIYGQMLPPAAGGRQE